MKVRHFLSNVEHARVHEAIKAAELDTSGDIVLFISHRRVGDPLAAANLEFRKMHLETATDKNSLLIFLAPKSQTFAVVGGTAFHDKLGQVWWENLVALLTKHFKDGHYTNGLIAAIEEAGRALKTHFSSTSTDRTGQLDIVEE